MDTITNCFIDIIKKQKELDYPFPRFLSNPADLHEIHETESVLDLKFNDELIEMYSFANGTQINEDIALGLIGLIPIHRFLSLEDAVIYYNLSIGFEQSFEHYITGYKPGKKLFPFLTDHGGNCYWVDLNTSSINYGRIYWTNTFGEDPDYLFDSLGSMFQVISESYMNGAIKLDNNKYLDCDYDQFGQIAKKYNPNVTYWEIFLETRQKL